MKVKFTKLLETAVAPLRATGGAAGLDLTAATDAKFVQAITGPYYEYDTGLAFEIPEGHVGRIYPRSSITSKTTLTLGNSIGVIDSDFRGTIKFQFRTYPGFPVKLYEKGDRIGQIIIEPIPTVEFEEVKKLGSTERNTGGYGSTGK